MKWLKDCKIGDTHHYPLGAVVSKTPMEHNVRFTHGDPYAFITAYTSEEDKRIYYLWELNTEKENREYELTEISENFGKLHEKLLAINEKISDKLYPPIDYSKWFGTKD